MSKNIVIIVLSIIVLGLGGYLLYDKVLSNDNAEINENKEEAKEENNTEINDDNIPYLDNLISIAYTQNSMGEEIFKSKIRDKETMKQVLSVFKNKTLLNEEPTGLGGAGYIMLTLEYENSIVEIMMLGNLIEIDDQFYNVNYTEGDYYQILKDIFE